MRKVAKKMREAAAEMEADMVDVRKEDETLRPFDIPFAKLNDHGVRCAFSDRVLHSKMELCTHDCWG